jgi:hypothetical protein
MFEIGEQAWRSITELYIPLAGVAASTAVAVAALRVSRSAAAVAAAAERDRAAAAHKEMIRGFSAATMAYFERARLIAIEGNVPQPPLELTQWANSDRDGSSGALLFWLDDAFDRIVRNLRPEAMAPAGSARRARELVLDALRWTLIAELEYWASRGELRRRWGFFEHELIEDSPGYI